MKASNIYLIAGVVLMGAVIIGGQYLFKAPEAPNAPSVNQSITAVVSSDGLAKMAISAQSGIGIGSVTPWQVIGNDVLVDTFVTGYSISDPANAISSPILMEINLERSPSSVPYVFQEVNGLTSLVDSVEYVVDNGSISTLRFEVQGAGKVFVLEQYTYRGTRPAVSLLAQKRQEVLMGDKVSGEIGFLINPDFSIYGHELNKEKAYIFKQPSFNIVTRYSDGNTGKGYTLTELLDGNEVRVPISSEAICAEGSALPDVAIEMSFVADLYERSVFDWLRVPVSGVEWQLIEGAVGRYQQTFLIRQPFICVAE